jgi:pyruvate dehydrogenase E2 component (dihydrolipoamide acetyltransferase)
VRRPRMVVDSSGEEQLAARSVTHLALRYDARVVESSDAARYLAAVKRRLEMWDRMSADRALAHDGTR